MSFLNPILLWGALGISVPVLIHLLNRYRHRELDWAAMELLRKALVVRSRQIRLEDVLILLLRCLAVLLIAFAMARPTLRASGGRWFGRGAEVGVVIALDGSYSMSHRPGIHTRFDDALQRVREVLKTVSPGSPVSLVLMGKRPRILLRNVGYDAARFERVLSDLAPLPERLDLDLCLEELEALLRELKAPMRECYLVTDAQAATWQELSEKARRTLQQMGTEARLLFLSTASESVENLAVTHFALASGTLRKGSMARCVAELHNFGRHSHEKVTASLLLDGKRIDQRVVDRVAAGSSVAVPLFARFDRVGSARLSLNIGSDPLLVDNARHAVAFVRDHVRILCVDGDPSDQPYRGETAYLVRALVPKPSGVARPSLAIKPISWLELPSHRLAEYDVVILANVPDVSRERAKELAAFVQQGGGLLIFLGDKVIPRLFNARMQQSGAALLPAEVESLGSPQGRRDGWPMEALVSNHPLSAPLEALPRKLLDEARFQQYFKLRLAPGGRGILKLAGTDSLLLAEKSLGRGRILLFASTADRAWSNLVIHPAYPILLHQAVTYLTRQAHERPFTVGEAVSLSLPGPRVQATVNFRDPNGKVAPIQVTERNGEKMAEYASPELPGFYEVQYAEGTPPLALAVNVDAAEADVRCLRAGELVPVFKGLRVRLVSEGDDLAMAIRESRVGRELWRVLLVLALAVLAVEAFLAHRFSRRIAGAASAPAETPREELLSPRKAT